MNIRCKRIIEGKTYNTETANQIEGWTEDHDQPWPHQTGVYLYQNRFGSFFLYTFLNGTDEEDYEGIKPLTHDQARRWLEKNRSNRSDLIELLFGQMPEAGSGEAKYTLRLPERLRDRLAALAKANKQSLNAWIVRCLETCASEPTAADPDSNGGRQDIPPMGNLVGSNRTGWRPKGT